VLNRVVINFHGGDLFPENNKSLHLQKLTSNLIPKVKGIVVPSEYFRNEIVERYKVDRQKVFVSPSGGVDREQFCIIDKGEYKVSGFLNIGYVGRLDFGKGLDVLIDGFISLFRMGYKVKLHIVGDGVYLPIVRDVVEKNGIKESVLFYGMRPQQELPLFFNSFDVFVFPSIRKGESLGLVGLEALACGVPVIGSNIGGISTYVEEGVNGFLFQPNDSKSLLAAFDRFLQLSQSERELMRANAVKSSKRFDSQRVRLDLIEFLNALF